jgi:hypothetical protein
MMLSSLPASLEAARNTAFRQWLYQIRGIREIRGSFLLLQDASL